MIRRLIGYLLMLILILVFFVLVAASLYVTLFDPQPVITSVEIEIPQE